MELETEAEGRAQVTSLSELGSRLTRLDPSQNSFAILSRNDETYIQAGAQEDDFIIEKRDGDFTRHYYAARPGMHQPLRKESWLIPQANRGQDRFSREEMLDIFGAFFSGTRMPASVTWVPMKMPNPRAFSTNFARWSRIAVWLALIAVFVGVTLWLEWKHYHL